MLGYAWDGSLRVGDEPPLFCLFVLVGWVCLVIYLSVFMAFSLEERLDGLNILMWCHFLSVTSADLSWIRCWSSCTRLSNVTFADDASDRSALMLLLWRENSLCFKTGPAMRMKAALNHAASWDFFSLRSLQNYSTFYSSPFDWSLIDWLISDWLSFILAC